MLYIVIPTYNRPQCINSIINQINKQSLNEFKLVIVDHGTKKVQLPRSEKIQILKANPELWWTGAVNIGLRYTLSKTSCNSPILILNDDVEISNSDYLNTLYSYWNKHKHHLIGSMCTSKDGSIIYANMIHNYRTATLTYNYLNQNIDSINKFVLDSHVLKGRGTLIPSDILNSIGIYNEKYLPHYKADHELIYRAFKKGYKIKVLKNAILHSELNSPNTVDKNNRFRSLWKVFWGIRSVANLKDLFYYSFLCFNPFYALYYFIVNSSKIILTYTISALK